MHLGNYAAKAFDLSYKYIIDLDEKVAEKGHKTEEAINTIDEQLTRYLIALSSEALSQKESEVLTNILDSSRDLERIGDHTEALLNLTDYLQRKNVEFSDAALKELEEVYRQTSDFIKDALDSVENNDIEKARSLVERHEAINKDRTCSQKNPHQTPQQRRMFNTSWGQLYRHHLTLHSCIRPRYEPC